MILRKGTAEYAHQSSFVSRHLWNYSEHKLEKIKLDFLATVTRVVVGKSSLHEVGCDLRKSPIRINRSLRPIGRTATESSFVLRHHTVTNGFCYSSNPKSAHTMQAGICFSAHVRRFCACDYRVGILVGSLGIFNADVHPSTFMYIKDNFCA